MTCGGGGSRSRSADEPGGADEPTSGPTDESDENDEDGQDADLLEQVADAVGDLWDDEADEP